jgi:hypothetical protein
MLQLSEPIRGRWQGEVLVAAARRRWGARARQAWGRFLTALLRALAIGAA